MKAPRIAPKPYRTRHHGIVREDEYHWLEAKNWREVLRDGRKLAPEIRSALMAENAWCAHKLQPARALEKQLFAEMRAALPPTEHSVPRLYKHYAWQSRCARGKEHAAIYRLARADAFKPGARGRKILDGNDEAKTRPHFHLKATAPSPDNQHLAWAFDVQGREAFTIRVRACASRRDLPDQLDNTIGHMAWSACGAYLFYVALNAEHRPDRVMRHRLGTPQARDVCVYQERDAGFFVSLSSLRSGAYINICAHTHETSEIHMLDAHAPLTAPHCLSPRQQGREYYADHDAARARFIVHTNLGGREDFCLMHAPERARSARAWRMLVPHRKGRLILQHAVLRDHLVWLAIEEAQPQLGVHGFARGRTRTLMLERGPHALELDAGDEYDSHVCRLRHSSLTSPPRIWAYDLARQRRTLLWQQKLGVPHAPGDYRSRRLFARARDGARVPISLVWHKDTPLAPESPLWLYAYGAYGTITAPTFSAARLSLMRRGIIYAIAHVRGGSEKGQAWFLQGRGRAKRNSFEDCVAAARTLTQKRIGAPGRIVLHGGSAGGLLVGACINLAPELFGVALAEVPFVDALTTMLNADLPLTPPEWPEWGNPIASKAAYRTIAAWAPYENIRAARYPHILATAGLSDPRVTYWEAAKWVARLRARRTDDGMTLLHTKMTAGHGGRAGRFNALRDAAFVYSFALYALTRLADSSPQKYQKRPSQPPR